MNKLFLALILTFSFSAIAQEAFHGTWKSNDGEIIFYGYLGRVDYEACPADLDIDVKTIDPQTKHITFKKLKSVCESEDNFPFNEKLPIVTFVLKNGQLKTIDGEKAGTMTDSKMDVQFDSDMQTFYLEGEINNGSMWLGWYARSLEALNYNFEGKFNK